MQWKTSALNTGKRKKSIGNTWSPNINRTCKHWPTHDSMSPLLIVTHKYGDGWTDRSRWITRRVWMKLFVDPPSIKTVIACLLMKPTTFSVDRMTTPLRVWKEIQGASSMGIVRVGASSMSSVVKKAVTTYGIFWSSSSLGSTKRHINNVEHLWHGENLES